MPWSSLRPGERIEVAFIPGCTVNSDDAIEQMKRQTHDALLDMLGTGRRSAIRWQRVDGRTESERVLRALYEEDPGALADVEREYFPFLAEHGDHAVTVIAMCDAAVPA